MTQKSSRHPSQTGAIKVALLVFVFFVLAVSVYFTTRGVHTAKANPPSSIQWTPGEIASMPPVVLLKAGDSLELGIATGNSGIDPGGQWSRQWGRIQNGTYTAPNYIPSGGTDTVTYTDPDGAKVDFTVRVLPNPAILGSEQTQFIQSPYSTDPSPCETGGPSPCGGTSPSPSPTPTPVGTATPNPGPPSGGSTADNTQSDDETQTADDGAASAWLPDNIVEPVLVLGPGESVTPPSEITAVQNLATETVNGESVYRLPSADYPSGQSPLVVKASGIASLQMAREVPTASAAIIENRNAQPAELCVADDTVATQNSQQAQTNQAATCKGCKAGTKKAGDPLPMQESLESATPATLMTISVTVALKAAAKLVGIDLTVGGTYNIQILIYNWTRTQKTPYYKCVNGTWYYDYTKVCVWKGTAAKTIPPWAIIGTGYPKNGKPDPNQWVGPACKGGQ